MSASTYTIPVHADPITRPHALRLALAVVAVVVLLTLAFVIGRSTATATKAVPAVTTPVTAPIGPSVASTCRMGRPC